MMSLSQDSGASFDLSGDGSDLDTDPKECLDFLLLDLEMSSTGIIDLIGVDHTGASICVHVSGFRNFFYWPVPAGLIDGRADSATVCRTVVAALSSALKCDISGIAVNVVQRKPLCFCRGEDERGMVQLLKVEHVGPQKMAVRALKRAAAGLVERLGSFGAEPEAIETGVPHLRRFLIETELSGVECFLVMLTNLIMYMLTVHIMLCKVAHGSPSRQTWLSQP
jgi:hypothetical protein